MTESAKCSFSDPPARQYDNSLRARNAADDDQQDAEREAAEQCCDVVVDAAANMVQIQW